MDAYLFSGLRVIDLSTVIAAPAAAMMLADFGEHSQDILRELGYGEDTIRDFTSKGVIEVGEG